MSELYLSDLCSIVDLKTNTWKTTIWNLFDRGWTTSLDVYKYSRLNRQHNWGKLGIIMKSKHMCTFDNHDKIKEAQIFNSVFCWCFMIDLFSNIGSIFLNLLIKMKNMEKNPTE